MTLDPRLNAYRNDLADERLRGTVAASRYVAGRPARIVAGRAPVRRWPAAQADLDTFYHYGEEVLIFEEADGHVWCQSLFDGYVGYAEARHIAIGAAPAPTHFVATLGSYVYDAPDLRSAVVDFLPRHSAVVVAETGLSTRERAYVRLDNGGFMPLACLARAPPRSSNVAAAAALYLGCPYLWGGRSFLGIDCSGLVQNAFRDIGVVVPRDADMQRASIGAKFGARSVQDLIRGDLIYVSGHVLIGLGGGRAIHADGTNMIVRRQKVSEFLDERGLRLSDATLRRIPPGSSDTVRRRVRRQ